MGWCGWGGLNPNLVSALAPFGLVRAGAEIGAELDNCSKSLSNITQQGGNQGGKFGFYFLMDLLKFGKNLAPVQKVTFLLKLQ